MNERTVDDDEVAGGDRAVEEASPGAGRREATRRAFPVALALVAVVLATIVVWLGVRLTSGSDDEPPLVAARQTITDMLTIEPGTADRTLERLTSGATGEFADQLHSRSGNFSGTIRDAGVSSTGTVTSAGIAESGPGRAVVLASANSEVRNSQVPDGEARQYRMRLTVEEEGEQWRVSRLEFVP